MQEKTAFAIVPTNNAQTELGARCVIQKSDEQPFCVTPTEESNSFVMWGKNGRRKILWKAYSLLLSQAFLQA